MVLLLSASGVAWGAPSTAKSGTKTGAPTGSTGVGVAAPRSRVAVISHAVDALVVPAAHELEAAGEVAVGQEGRLQLVELQGALDPVGARDRGLRRAEGETALERGLKAYDDLDTEKAEEQFGVALKALRSSDLSRTRSVFVRAWVMKVASMVANGASSKALRQELERLLGFDPRAEFSRNYFPPDTLKLVEELRRAQAQAKGKIRISSSAPGARIYVDGQPRGLAPLTVEGLTPGEHIVTALGGGFGFWQQGVSPGTPVDIALSPAPGYEPFRVAVDKVVRGGAARSEGVRELGAVLGADQLLVMVLRKSAVGEKVEVVGFRFDAASGRELGGLEAILPAADSAAAQGFVRELLTTRRGAGRGANGFVSGERGEPPPPLSGRQVAGLALLGSGAALLAGGTFLGLRANGLNAEFQTIPQVDVQKAEQVRAAGKSYAIVADVFFLGGLLAGVSGGILALTAGPPEARPEAPAAVRAPAAPPPAPETPAVEKPSAVPPPEDEAPPAESPPPRKRIEDDFRDDR